jgi:diguanylate cyclase (GGDEF)-like protein
MEFAETTGRRCQHDRFFVNRIAAAMRLGSSHSAEQRLRLMQDIAARLGAEMSLRQILAEVAGILRERFDWDYVGCAHVDADEGLVRYAAHASALRLPFDDALTQPVGEGIIGQVAASGIASRIDDVLRHDNYVCMIGATRSELCVPVLSQGETIAVLDAQSSRTAAFSDEDVATLNLVAELLAGRMAAARQLEATRQRAELIELLADVARAMLGEDELGAMLQRLIDELHRRLDLTLSTLCLLRPGGELVLHASAGESSYPLVHGERWPASRGVTGRALRGQVRVFVPDVRRDLDYIEGNPRSVAELVVPIRFRGEPLGLINLESATPAAFSPANQIAVQALADQAAGAIRLALTKQQLEAVNAEASTVAAQLAATNRRLQRANAKLDALSLRDPLTGLGNRRCFDRTLQGAWRDCQRQRAPLALLLVDIDHYKAFNDRYGHAEGDLCLQRLGRLMQRLAARRRVVAARYGGEEFALVLPGADRRRALALAERMHAALAALQLPHAASPTAPALTISIGVAIHTPDGLREPGDLLRDADLALYAAKRDGRNRTVVAS